MKLLDSIAARLGYARKLQRARSFDAARVNRLTGDWQAQQTSADAELFGSLRVLRGRSRDLERNNDYARRYFKALEQNVLGSTGIGLQMKVRDFNGSFDRVANERIESAWYRWGEKGVCTIDGLHSWQDAQRLILRSTARDGAVLLRKMKGARVNAYGFALQLLEIDHLDLDYQQPQGPNPVRFGVEYESASFKPVAYWILTRHPGDLNGIVTGQRRVRVPASEIIHIFLPDRVGQTTGYPWLVSAMTRLNMLGAYEEAELVAARIGASKGGFYEHAVPADYQGPTDSQGNPVQSMEPGSFEDLPMGTTFKPYDPQHPTQAFPFFVKACLRGIASGLGMSYNTLANDLEGVNYSSIRAGLLDEREEWKLIQNWFIEHVCMAVFPEWLEMSLLTGAVNLPFAKFDKFNAHEWKPRRWGYVNPLQDIQAQILQVEKGFASRRKIIAEGGGDIQDTFLEQSEDKKLADSYGLNFTDAASEGVVETEEAIDQARSKDNTQAHL